MLISVECLCYTQWGESVYITGSVKELGDFDEDKAIELKCIAPNKWLANFNISSKFFSYRYFKKHKESGEVIREYGAERNFKYSMNKFEQIHIKDVWNSSGLDRLLSTKVFKDIIFSRKKNEVKQYSYSNKSKNILELTVCLPKVEKGQVVGVVGSIKELGSWNEKQALVLDLVDFPIWKTSIVTDKLPPVFEYKYVIIDKKTGKIVFWELGDNRVFNISKSTKNTLTINNDGMFRYPNNNPRGAGVSLPVFSIRTKNSFGVGEFLDLKKVVDWSLKSGLKIIQLLPINDTISTHSFLDSYPYKAISVFALHPIYINIFKLGKIKNETLYKKYKKLQTSLNKNTYVDYDKVLELKLKYLKILFEETKTDFLNSSEFEDFFNKNKSWLTSYAAFSYLRDKYKISDFREWEGYQKFSKTAISKLFKEDDEAFYGVSFWYFVQFNLEEQLKEAVSYGRKKGVAFKGDIPIGISRNSADAWTNPKLFYFEGQAGAPPDDFSANGQNWGFPTYNWDKMEKDKFLWWQNRLQKMSDYFDAYRIDHILGFFRIWEIPYSAVQGVLGHFNPSLPISSQELKEKGVLVEYDRFCKPYIREHFLGNIFGPYTNEVVKKYLNKNANSNYELKEKFNTQRKIHNHFLEKKVPEKLSDKDKTVMNGLLSLAAEVLLLIADGAEKRFHPRVAMHSTYSYAELSNEQKDKLNEVYNNYFYHRHNDFWKSKALKRLPTLVKATNMLVCGEDLGMIPASVPQVMKDLGILSLEIQRMPKNTQKTFANPLEAPYLSVCTTSTHDMSTIRGWWEDDRNKTQQFYSEQLQKNGKAPYFAEPWVCKDIIFQHLQSPAMWTIFPIQDLLAISGELRSDKTHEERINNPANPRHYWKYRMHISMEDLIKEQSFNNELLGLIKDSGRFIN